jgi:hypothetical protein
VGAWIGGGASSAFHHSSECAARGLVAFRSMTDDHPDESGSTEPEKQVRWWNRPLGSIPLRWMRHESFYRDLTVNILASGIVLIIGYLYAIGAGYVRSPTGSQTLAGIWNAFFTTIVIVFLFASVFWPMFFNPFQKQKYAHYPRWRLWGWRALWILDMTWLGLAFFHTMSGEFSSIWPFNTPRWYVPMAPRPK